MFVEESVVRDDALARDQDFNRVQDKLQKFKEGCHFSAASRMLFLPLCHQYIVVVHRKRI